MSHRIRWTSLNVLNACISALLVVFFFEPGHGENVPQSNVKPIQSANRVMVEVGGVTESLAKYGITPDQVRTVVELRLRKNGIPIESPDSLNPGFTSLSTWNHGSIRLSVTAIKAEDGMIFYSVDIVFLQEVIDRYHAKDNLQSPLTRSEVDWISTARQSRALGELSDTVSIGGDPILIWTESYFTLYNRLAAEAYAAITWRDHMIAYAHEHRIREQLDQVIMDLVDSFSNQWLAVHDTGDE